MLPSLNDIGVVCGCYHRFYTRLGDHGASGAGDYPERHGADGAGFAPALVSPNTVFETVAFVCSANHPNTKTPRNLVAGTADASFRGCYANGPETLFVFRPTNPLTLCGYSQLFVKFAAYHEPVHVAVGESLRTVPQFASADPHVEGVSAHGDPRVGEDLGYIRRATSFRVVPAEFFQSPEFDGPHSLLGVADGARDPLVVGSGG